MHGRSFLNWLAAPLFAIVLARAPEAWEPSLTHGPLLGAVSDDSLKVWTRLDGPGRVRVRWWPEGRPDAARVTLGPKTGARSDFTSVVHVTGLQPATRYAYGIETASVAGREWRRPLLRERLRFTTLRRPGTAGKLRVVLAADIMHFRKATGLLQMRDLAPDFALLLGDNTYLPNTNKLSVLRERYRKAWRAAPIRALTAQVPTFMIWDDHEIRDNYWAGRPHSDYRVARRAYEEYQHSHNPEPLRAGELYYRIVAGDVEIFVLDTRTHRDGASVKDGPGKTMLGPDQLRALLEWIERSQARVKILATSVMLSRRANTGYDSWNGFAHERRVILDAMTGRGAAPTLVVSGDQHWNGLLRIDHKHAGQHRTFYELLATPLAAPRRFAPGGRARDFLARDDDHLVFGVVDVDTTVTPLRVALTMCAVDARCRPGHEKPPRPRRDRNGERDTLPYTVVLTPSHFGLAQRESYSALR